MKRIRWTPDEKETVFQRAAELVASGEKFTQTELFTTAQRILGTDRQRKLEKSANRIGNLHKEFKVWSASKRTSAGLSVASDIERAKDKPKRKGRPLGSKNGVKKVVHRIIRRRAKATIGPASRFTDPVAYWKQVANMATQIASSHLAFNDLMDGN